MLNRALRLQDIEIIIEMGWFLRDLHRQIEQLYLTSDHTNIFTVYRGQGMLNAEFEKIIASKGGLLSFNNFLSTSNDRQVSYTFAVSARQNPNLTGILFEMTVDPRVSTTPFASISAISSFPDEEEVLFAVHTVFRLDDLQQIDDRLWQVNLTLTNDVDQQLTQLAKYMQKEIEGNTGWERLASLMLTMGEYNKAEDIYKNLLETSLEDDLEKHVCLLEGFARALFHTGHLTQALSVWESTTNIREKSFPSNYFNLSLDYRRLGAVHGSLEYYPTAISYYQKTLDIQEKYFPDNYPELASTYNNMAWTCCLTGQNENALLYCEKSIENYQKSTPSIHPHLSTAYDTMGKIYYSMGDYPNAILYYLKTMDIQKKSLQPNHPLLASGYFHIGAVYRAMEEHTTALSYYEKTLEIRLKVFDSHHLDLAAIFNDIGELYYSMNKYSIALTNFEKAREILQKSLPPTHSMCVNNKRNIDSVRELVRER
ncbi:unnamed protein product [Adineta ricciae]|uniref:NAD(P)(+)--arginine ADP-ribosyltransferase n=1 Tax=Adineta ricciae TaxID=249248 RepID=A0A814BEV5_ADIRI|nr:unnamed protein product [Adineta ricciae]CAF1283012.1 unnamed protein product [Adineta ricciae]